jgi:hypothetical protein
MPEPTTSLGHVHNLFRVNPSPVRWPIALKAAVAGAIPLTGSIALGHPGIGLMATLGSFTVLYGPTTAGRFRIRLMLSIAFGLIAAASLGALTAGHPMVTLLSLVGVAMVATFVCITLKIGPPGSYFPVLVIGVANLLASRGMPVAMILGAAALGAGTAILVGMSDLVREPHKPERLAVETADRMVGSYAAVPPELDATEARAAASHALHLAWTTFTDGSGDRPPKGPMADLYTTLCAVHARYVAASTRLAARATGIEPHPWGDSSEESEGASAAVDDEDIEQLRESSLGRPEAAYLFRSALTWPSEILLAAVRVGLATLLAGLLSMALGIGHAYWAVAFSALILYQGGTRIAQTYRGIHRMLGTFAGLVLFALIGWVHPTGWWLVPLIFALQFTVELLVIRNYGLAVAFITPLALVIATAGASPGAAWSIMGERTVDTLIGVIMALSVLWLIGRGTSVTLLRGHGRRCIHAAESVLDDLLAGTVETPEARKNRRHLYFEILEAEQVARRSATDEPGPVAEYLPMDKAVQRLCYALLGACWHPQLRAFRQAYEQAKAGFAAITATPVTRPRPAADIQADVQAIYSAITTLAALARDGAPR